MRDPLTWSFPLGRLFGITIRVHWLFPVVAVGLILRVYFKSGKTPGFAPGAWIDMSILLGLLFLSVLLHEFGHCFGARRMDGDATDILIWPLGGLATVDVPHTARAHLVTVVGGPAVNLLLCAACTAALLWGLEPHVQPPLDPFTAPLRVVEDGTVEWTALGGGHVMVGHAHFFTLLLARLFWVNWVLLLLNVVLIGFPLDGGRIFQCLLWPYLGYRQATLAAVFAGYVTMFIVGIYAIVDENILALCLAVFIYVSCNQQWILLETGGEESMFGYDFSQGYTSLERETGAPRRRRQSWWQRWQQRRAARRMQREQERREAEERRMDELLQKVQTQGLPALTDEERRFLKRVSDRYRKH
jgi:Zn-dependent protease